MDCICGDVVMLWCYTSVIKVCLFVQLMELKQLVFDPFHQTSGIVGQICQVMQFNLS